MYENIKALITPLVKNLSVTGTTVTDFTWLLNFEEVVPHMYKDHVDKITVGIGHNIDDNDQRVGVNRLAFELQNPADLKNTSPEYLRKLGEKFKDKFKTALPTARQTPSLLIDLITNPTKLNVHFFASVHHNIIRKISFKELILFEYDYLSTIPKGKSADKYRANTILNLRNEEIVRLFAKDVKNQYDAVSGFPKDDLPQEIQKALIDIAFNIGGRNLTKNYPTLKAKLNAAVKAEKKDKAEQYLEAVLESRREAGSNSHAEQRNIFVAECFFWVAARYLKQNGATIKEAEDKLKEGLKNYRACDSYKKYTGKDQSKALENKIPTIASQA